jgi:hypothetical protein
MESKKDVKKKSLFKKLVERIDKKMQEKASSSGCCCCNPKDKSCCS